MGQASRDKRYRQRQRYGVSVVAVPIDRLNVASALVESGRLRPSQTLQRNAVASALSTVIEEWAAAVRWEATEDSPSPPPLAE